jgi:hypothetical protein
MLKILFLSLISLSSFAQVNLMQSSPDINWKQIEDDNFRVVYPDYIEAKAQYIVNLLNHYQTKVSDTYDKVPDKLTLILRPELSVPNGFVTLGPRRSEWFTSASFTPFVGSLDWYQSLAIHEYRHVVQLDYLNRSNVRVGHFLFGDTITSVLMNIIMPNWYFEGDAVWTETVLSNAGRGRSPRFSNRLKALVQSGQTPKYDDLLAGDYTTNLPNLYVYGYYLITRAYKVYGKKVWKEVAAIASDSPINPFAFYNAFYNVTSKNFDEFYSETMLELQLQWGKTQESNSKKLYTTYSSPIENNEGLFYLKKDLDSYWGLYKQHNNQEVKIDDFNVITSLSKVDLSEKNFLYTQVLPDSRYSFKSYTDLFLYDLNSKKNNQITKNKRIYHPKFNNDASQILALEYTDKNIWQLVVMDLKGSVIKIVPSRPGQQITEAVWKNDNELIAFTLQQNGMKQISHIDLNTNLFTSLTQPTRNNLYSLAYYEDAVYFEADDKGVNNILKFDLIEKSFSRCTHANIGAHTPSIYNGRLSYVQEIASGKELVQKSIGCELIEENILDFEYYIGESPSDNFHESVPVTIEGFEKLSATTLSPSEYPVMENALTPHSWSFIGGRGSEVSIQTSNYLNTFNLTGSIGESSEESKPFASLALAYSKYYPIFILDLGYAGRRQDGDIKDSEWEERNAGLSILLPYISRNGLYNILHTLNLNTSYISVGDNDNAFSDELDGENLAHSGFELKLSVFKSLRSREIKPSFGMAYSLNYKDFKTSQSLESKSYFASTDLTIYLPGIIKNHSFSITSLLEYRPEDRSKYQTQDNYVPTLGYTFSRGFAYEFTPRFTKTSLDYTLPLEYPKDGLGNWLYLNRISANLFYDHTYSEFLDGAKTLVSKGIELNFESLTVRKFHLNYGLRYLHKQNDDTKKIEFFITL